MIFSENRLLTVTIYMPGEGVQSNVAVGLLSALCDATSLPSMADMLTFVMPSAKVTVMLFPAAEMVNPAVDSVSVRPLDSVTVKAFRCDISSLPEVSIQIS